MLTPLCQIMLKVTNSITVYTNLAFGVPASNRETRRGGRRRKNGKAGGKDGEGRVILPGNVAVSDADSRGQAYRVREFSRALVGSPAACSSRRDDAWDRKIPLRIGDPSLSAQQTTAKSGAALARGWNAPCESVGPGSLDRHGK